jgi:hypothetical protein
MSLILSIFVLVTASFAWLSINKDTHSNGMQLKVQVTPNLIINDNSSTLQGKTGPTESDFTITFSTPASAKRPATHDWSVGTTSGLKYVTNPTEVGTSSGLVKSGSTLTYGPVASSPTSEYYVDYTVYIASTGSSMTGQDLVATLDPTASIVGTDGIDNDTLKATSIDFYYGSVSQSNYRGTLNVAGYDISTNNQSPFTSVPLLDNGEIPLNTSSYITIVMRCYFDGELLKSAGQAFINTATVDANNVTINVKFTASDHS